MRRSVAACELHPVLFNFYVTLGVFLCNRCYGLHRALGAHITRVKCLGLDLWAPDEVENAEAIVHAQKLADAGFIDACRRNAAARWECAVAAAHQEAAAKAVEVERLRSEQTALRRARDRAGPA